MKVADIFEEKHAAFNRDTINSIVNYYKSGQLSYVIALKQLCNNKGISMEQAKQLLNAP